MNQMLSAGHYPELQTVLAELLAELTELKQPKQKLKFREQMRLEREKLVIETVNELLSSRGFEAMTVDEVAERVGIAKASLYRHFSSKEALGVAALLSVMNEANALIELLDTKKLAELEKLQLVCMWALQKKAQKQMPNLPSSSGGLRDQLMNNPEYTGGLVRMSDKLGGWIETCQEAGVLDAKLPALVILYSLYAKACDPVLDFLIQSQLYTEQESINWVLQTFFGGMLSRKVSN